MTAKRIIEALWGDPRKIQLPRDVPEIEWGEEDLAIAARSPFTAYEKALEIGRHDERLWAAIKGSVYERPYRERFRI